MLTRCAVQPRYHFCGGEGQFWQRPAYTQGGDATHVCRMIGMGNVQAETKGRRKWLHALSLTPMGAMAAATLAQSPADATACPYPYARLSTKRAASGGGGGGGEGGDGGAPAPKRPRPEFAKDARGWVAESCWFCMSSPKFETHLVASIGEETYVAMAKGPLVPLHVLVLPIVHKRCTLELSESEDKEVAAYLGALRKRCEAHGEVLLVFERCVAGSNPPTYLA